MQTLKEKHCISACLRYCNLSSQAPLPDTYRGIYREEHPNPGQAYADTVKHLVEEINKKGRKVHFSPSSCFSGKTGNILKIY